MARESFIFHLEYRKYLSMLPAEKRLAIFDFLLDFAESDGIIDIPDTDDTAVKMVLMMITGRMVDDFRKYDETRAKRAEGGKLGGRPPKPQGIGENLKVIEEPKGNSENLSKAKKPVYVSDTDTVSVSGNECVSDTVTNTHTIIDQVKDYCRSYCAEKGYPVPSEEKMLRYAKYASGYNWKPQVARMIEHDEFIRKSTPIKVPQQATARHFNNERSEADLDIAVDAIMGQEAM